MGRTVSITFRVPVVDASAGALPATVERRGLRLGKPFATRCGHRRGTAGAAKKCARAMSLGWTHGCTEEVVVIVPLSE